MPLPEFKGKGLFVFSDPGGARNILSMAQELNAAHAATKIVSDRSYALYSDFGLDIETYNGSAASYFEHFEPDFLLCGTSYTSGIELAFIREARKRNISSYAYIDHWTSMRKRFTWKEEQEVLPGKILVIDERAKAIAVAEGLPPENIILAGQPYLKYLGSWRPQWSKSEFLGRAGIADQHKKMVVFAPDPLSNVNGLEVYGFDETTGMRELSELALSLKDTLFLIKPHPNQQVDLIRPFENSHTIILDKDTDSNHLIYYADVVMGFFSSFLLEAHAMKKPVIRYHAKPVLNDPLAHLAAGTIASPKTISEMLNKILW